MDVNKIKQLSKDELLQKLGQCGYSEIANILKDKDVDGRQFIEFQEFELFRWKFLPKDKKILWKCINDIRTNPSKLMIKSLPPKQIFNANVSSTKCKTFKEKLENVLIGNGETASGQSEPVLPRKPDQNKFDKNPQKKNPPLLPTSSSNYNRSHIESITQSNIIVKKEIPLTNNKIDNSTVKNVTSSLPSPLPPPLPPNYNRSSNDNKKQTHNINQKKPLSLPRPLPNKPSFTNKPPLSPPTSADEQYLDMSGSKKNSKSEETDDYLTPNDLSENSGPQPLQVKNFSGIATNLSKNISRQNAPFKPIRNTGSPGIGLRSTNINQQPTLSRSSIPTFQAEEHDDTYEAPPSVANNNIPSGSRIQSSLRKIVVQSEEEEADGIYEAPPPLKPKIIINDSDRIIDNSVKNHVYYNTVILDTPGQPKTTVSQLENIVIIEKEEPQETILDTLFKGGVNIFNNSFGKVFKNKNRTKKEFYENHVIKSENVETKHFEIRNRPLPRTPLGHNEDNEPKSVLPPNELFSKPLPLPRHIETFSKPRDIYLELVSETDISTPSPIVNIPQHQEKIDDFAESTVIDQEEDLPEYGNTSVQHVQNMQTIDTLMENTIDQLKSMNTIQSDDEQLVEYGNTPNNNASQGNIQIGELAALLNKKLKEREEKQRELEKLANRNRRSRSPKVEDELEVEEQSIYTNTPSPNTSRKNILPNYEVEDEEQPTYGNTPSPNLNRKNDSVTNKSKNDDEHPIHGNFSGSNINRTNNFTNEQKRNNVPIIKNRTTFEKIKTPSSSECESEFDDSEAPIYGNLDDDEPQSTITHLTKVPSPPPINKQLFIQTLGNNSRNMQSTVSSSEPTKIEKPIPIFKRPLPNIPNKPELHLPNNIDKPFNYTASGEDFNKFIKSRNLVNNVEADEEAELNNEPFYRNTDRTGAKKLLEKLEDGAFLFRKPTQAQNSYLVLTIKYKKRYYHLRMEKTPENKICLNAETGSVCPEFQSLREFIDYFVTEPVTFREKGNVVEIYLKPILPEHYF